jgi:hypothetical protein
MAKRTANRKEMRKVAEAAEAKDKTKEAKTPVVRKKKVGSRRSKSAAAERKRMVWVIYNGAIMINNMWIVLATWLCANVFILNNIVDNHNNNNTPETST